MAEQVIQGVENAFMGEGSGSVIFGAPTLDRPFGLALWPVFCGLCKRLFNWDPTTFQYDYNSDVLMSRSNQVALAIATYYFVIFAGREVMNSFTPIRINLLFKTHNLCLSVFSLVLVLLLVEQLVPIIVRHGMFYAICSVNSWSQPIVTLYYLNYLTKYYELLDTVFLVLRKRQLTFLHTYHHGATVLLCFNQLNGRTSVSWVPIVLNLAVHVLMYFYYLLAACGIRVWWKHWVTRFQIIQFIIDLGFVYFASYTYFAAAYWPELPNMGMCSGEESAALGGCLILTSYLVLFISFYIKNYLTPKATTRPEKLDAAKAAATAAAGGDFDDAHTPAAQKSTARRRKV